MRAMRRTTVAVPTLTGEGAGAAQARQHEADRALVPTLKLAFPKYWNNADVRGALYAMHGTACAYCGSRLTRGDRGDVEHFRPKGAVREDPAHGGYWWLAYAFDNYLMSCLRCNRQIKLSSFRLRPGGVRVVYATRADLHLEPRLLLDPTLDPVEDLLRVNWEADHCTIGPRDDLTADQRAQVEETLEMFRINIDTDLLEERTRVRNEVADAVLSGEFDRARVLAVRYQPHSLVARQILAEKAPAHLPSPGDELRWLMGYFVERRLLMKRTLETKPGDSNLKAGLDELDWSFATLWRDPPGGLTPADVERFLSDHAILDEVRRRYDLL